MSIGSTLSPVTTITISGTGVVDNGVCQARLTTESGVPVSTSDRTAQSTIYLTPYNGRYIALYDGANWNYHVLAEISLALSGLTSGKNYDVFVYNNAGTLTLELSAAWTNDTTRADALALQDGVYVKSGTETRRHVGTIRTTGTTTTEDSGGITGTTQVGGKRFVWNRYNPVRRHASVIDTTGTWSYTTDSWRQANAAAGNQVEFVVGADTHISALLCANWQGNNSVARTARVAIGLDSTSAVASQSIGSVYQGGTALIVASMTAAYEGVSGLGYHYLAWLERGSDGSGSFNGSQNGGQSALTAVLWN